VLTISVIISNFLFKLNQTATSMATFPTNTSIVTSIFNIILITSNLLHDNIVITRILVVTISVIIRKLMVKPQDLVQFA
jgi:hypothetical protein